MFLGYALVDLIKLGLGHSPGNNLAAFGGAQPPPHIKRHSRTTRLQFCEGKRDGSMVTPR